MPLLKIQTNVEVPEAKRSELLLALTDLVAAELGKPKEYVQVVLEPNVDLMFAGTTEPTAFVELRSLGLPTDKPAPLSESLSQQLLKALGVPANRVFLNFFDLPRTHWGWNGGTFG